MKTKIAISLDNLGQPFRKALETAAQLECEGVQLNARTGFRPKEMTGTALRELKRHLSDHRLSVSSVLFSTRRGYQVLEDLDARVAATRQAMDFAYSVGCRTVVNQVGPVPAEDADPAWDTMVEALSDLGRHGQRCGAILAAKTGTESGPRLLSLIDRLSPGSLQVSFDPGNLIVNGHSADEALHSLATHIAHVDARDGVRDLSVGRGIEVELGRGSVDWMTIMAVLDQQRYKGYFTINRPAPSDAISYLRSLV